MVLFFYTYLEKKKLNKVDGKVKAEKNVKGCMKLETYGE